MDHGMAEPPPPEDNLATLPELKSYIATREQERIDALKLVADSVAQQRQVANRSLIFSPVNMAAFLGLVPVEHRSGTSVRGRPKLSKAGHPRLRAALYMVAVVATRLNPDVRAQYQRLLARGKSKMAALGAAMRKLVHLCFGVRPRPNIRVMRGQIEPGPAGAFS